MLPEVKADLVLYFICFLLVYELIAGFARNYRLKQEREEEQSIVNDIQQHLIDGGHIIFSPPGVGVGIEETIKPNDSEFFPAILTSSEEEVVMNADTDWFNTQDTGWLSTDEFFSDWHDVPEWDDPLN